MVKALRIIIYLKIVNNDKFNANVLLITKNNKEVLYEFKVIVNSNANTTIKIMLNNIEENFEK